MPVNEVGDRVHNLFDQGSLSQEQHNTQSVVGNWPVYNTNVWVTNEGQIGRPLNSSSKNFSTLQSEMERGQSNQLLTASHGLNFTQSVVRPEFAKSSLHNQQLNLNGFMHRQNEANFLGGATESDQNNMASRRLPIVESQSQHSNFASLGGSESPMNFNLLGGQQQINGQQPGMLPRQQSAINDAQLLQQQQQAMFQQMQDLQRRQQLQQFEAMQRGVINHMPSFPNQTVEQHTPILNGSPMHDTSNCHWQSQAMAGNANWQQHRHPSPVQGYSNAPLFTPEQGQAMRFMGLVPQQASQSLHGVPVSNSGGAHPFSQNSMDKPGGIHAHALSSSFSGNPYTSHAEQASMQHGGTVSRSDAEGRSSFEHASSPGLGTTGNVGGFNQGQLSNVSMSGVGGQGFVGGSDVLSGKAVTQGSGSQATSSQAAVALDPSEEKFLFGNDVNIWEAFGSASPTGNGNDGADPFSGMPSLQSGTWSALMQSAVAETSSSDIGLQDEWGGLESQNCRSQSNQHPLNLHNTENPPVWVNSSQRGPMSSRTTSNDVSTDDAACNTDYLHSSGLPLRFSNQRSLPMEGDVVLEGRRWLDSHHPKPPAEKWAPPDSEFSRELSKDIKSFGSRQNMFLPESVHNSLASSNADTVGRSPKYSNGGHESRHRLPGNHNLDLWKSMNNSTNSGLVGSGNDQRNMNRGQSVFDSSVNVPDGGAAEVHGTENGGRQENSSDSHPNHAVPGSLKENMWSGTGDWRSFPGVQEMAGQGGKRLLGSRQFQHHPMEDVDVSESSYVAHQNSHLQSLSQNVSSGHEVQYRFLTTSSANSSDLDKGLLSGLHGTITTPPGVSSSGVHAGYLLNATVPFTRSGETSSPSQHMSRSQNMLELLHKVDHSKDQNAVSNLSSTEDGGFPDTLAVGCVGLGQSQSSTSHGFNLQLAPPSQGIASSTFSDPAQSSLRMGDSPSSQVAPSETGDKTHSWLASGSSPQCLPSSNRQPQVESVSHVSGSSGNANSSQPNMKGNLSKSMASSSPFLRNSFQNQPISTAGRQMMGNQMSNASSGRHPYHDQQMTTNQNEATIKNSFSNLHNSMESQRDTNQTDVEPPVNQMHPSVHAVTAGMRTHNVSPAAAYLWTSQQVLSAQGRNASDLHRSQFQSNNALESTLSRQKNDDSDSQRNTDALIGQPMVAAVESVEGEPRCSGRTVGDLQEECLVRQPMDAFLSSSTASQKETDALHQSSNSMVHRNYSLPNQMQAMKNVGDPSNRESKRMKGVDNGQEAQQLAGKAAEPVTGGMNSMVRDPSVSLSSVSLANAKLLSFSPQTGNEIISSQVPQAPVSSQDVFSLGCGDRHTFVGGLVASRAQHMSINPQLAPAWFEKYGSSKNGQFLPGHNVPRVPMVKNVDQQIFSGSFPSNACIQNPVSSATVTNSRQINPNAYPPTEHVTSLNALVPDVSAASQVCLRPKKRKTATSDLIPWKEEIGQGLKRLQNISLAEGDWAQSSNRLVERAEDLVDTNEYLLPMARPRRRLILTTKLMQEVFRPTSPSVLSLEARYNYEVIVYSIARLALGDACSLICGMESVSSPGTGNLFAVKAKTLGIEGQYFSKVMEDLTNRVKEMGNDLLRLEKRTSILDLRVDCQDLERFSVINRFARFHGRSQAEGVDSSSSSDATAMSQKSCPQRYVSAHPMPRTVPDSVQCLSL